MTDRVDDVKGSTKQMSGWKIVAFIVFGVFAVVLCAAIGYVVYTKTQTSSRKRFY